MHLNAIFHTLVACFAVLIVTCCSQETPSIPKNAVCDDSGANILNPSLPEGVYSHSIPICIQQCATDDIRYTLDGSEPSASSNLLNGAIWIGEGTQLQSNIDLIPTMIREGEKEHQRLAWKRPERGLPRYTLLKVRSFKNGEASSEVFAYRYIVQPHTVPVIAVEANHSALFSFENGMLVPGKVVADSGWSDAYWPNGNFRQGYKTNADIRYYETDGQLAFSGPIELKLHGQVVTSTPNKCFRFSAKKKLGMPKFEHPIFPNLELPWVKKFVARNSGNDFSDAFCRDVLVNRIVADMDVETMGSRPVVMYLNGVYWGLFHQREKYDRHYFESHFGIEKEDLNLIELCGTSAIVGSTDDYLMMVYYTGSNDPSDPNYLTEVEKYMDVDSYIDYLLTEFYFCNMDWPGNNVKIWRTNAPESRWRWLILDFDMSMGFGTPKAIGKVDFNMLAWVHGEYGTDDWRVGGCATRVMTKMLANKEFLERFNQRYVELSTSNFSSDFIVGKIDALEAEYMPEMSLQVARWGYPASIEDWQASLEELREFARKRPQHFEEHLNSFLNAALGDSVVH